MATLTVYPDPGSGSTTCDGYVYHRWDPGRTWADITGWPTSTHLSAVASSQNLAGIICDTNADKYSFLYRSIFTFDTSALTAGAIVSSAVFSVFANAGLVNTISPAQGIALVGSNPASDNALVAADYASLGVSLYAPALPLSSWATSSYNDFTLNATGLAAISKTGITKFGLTLDADRSNTEPTWVSGAQARVGGYYVDQAGTANDPKLVITYDASSPVGNRVIVVS